MVINVDMTWNGQTRYTRIIRDAYSNMTNDLLYVPKEIPRRPSEKQGIIIELRLTILAEENHRPSTLVYGRTLHTSTSGNN